MPYTTRPFRPDYISDTTILEDLNNANENFAELENLLNRDANTLNGRNIDQVIQLARVSSGLNSDTVDGYHATINNNSNTLVVRDGNKTIKANNIVLETTTLSPITLNSTVKVVNLNADLLDGYNTDTNVAPNTIPVRDSNGLLKGDITGNSNTTNKLKNPVTINLTGGVIGSAIFDGSSDISINVSVTSSGTVSNSNMLQGYTASVDNVPNTIPVRDSNGSIHANSTSSDKLSVGRSISIGSDGSGSATFDGSSNITIPLSLSPSAILSKLITVDGSGSGLDSDTVDGYHVDVNNTSNTIPVRDTSGNINANSTSASKLKNSRMISLDGDVTGSASFDGSSNISITSSINSTELLNKIKSIDGSGSGIDADLLDGMNASSNADSNTIVKRDSSGNFSANLITASLNGNASTSSKLLNGRTISIIGDGSGSTLFDGSSDVSINLSLNATNILSKLLTVDGSGSGLDADTLRGYQPSFNSLPNTIPIRDENGSLGNINATVTNADKLTNARTIAISGDASGNTLFDGSSNVNINLYIEPSTIINKVKNADGHGSELDADMLDGMQPSINSDPNTIVRRDSSGNITANTLITTSKNLTYTTRYNVNINSQGTYNLSFDTISGIITTNKSFFDTIIQYKILDTSKNKFIFPDSMLVSEISSDGKTLSITNMYQNNINLYITIIG